MKVEWRHTFFKLVGYFKAQEELPSAMLFGDRLKKAYGENR